MKIVIMVWMIMVILSYNLQKLILLIMFVMEIVVQLEQRLPLHLLGGGLPQKF